MTSINPNSKPNDAPLADRYGRRFNYLRLSVTEACNFRCNYCLPEGYCPSNREEALSINEIEVLVKTMARLGTRKVRISGGEPTLRKDLAEIIRICTETEGIEHVAMTSNGYRMDKQIDIFHAAGLRYLNLSADSLDPQTFATITGHDKLHIVLAALDRALELGISTKLNLVLMREYNANDLQKLMAFVESRPISLRLIELMRTNDNLDFYHRQHVSGQSILSRLESMGWSVGKRSALAGPAQELGHPEYQGRIGLIMPYSQNFCADCNRIRVAANGNLHMCLFHKADSNLRPYLKRGDIESLSEHLQSLSQHKWMGHRLQQGDSGETRHLAMLGG